jgi:Transposase DDE domain group 1
MTECTQQGFSFEGHFSRHVVAEFSGDRLTTEGGALLLREADRKIGLLRRVAECFTDTRQPERVEHPLVEMLAQRIYGLALG